MEPTSRESLRRAVRRAVHHACWQRLEGDHALIHADPREEIAKARATIPASDVSDEEVRQWIAEDETEFDRAILISDLVARRVQRTAATESAAASAVANAIPAPVSVAPRAESAATPAAAREIIVRTPVRTAPSIAALLDDMLAQQRAAANPRAAGA